MQFWWQVLSSISSLHSLSTQCEIQLRFPLITYSQCIWIILLEYNSRSFFYFHSRIHWYAESLYKGVTYVNMIYAYIGVCNWQCKNWGWGVRKEILGIFNQFEFARIWEILKSKKSFSWIQKILKYWFLT